MLRCELTWVPQGCVTAQIQNGEACLCCVIINGEALRQHDCLLQVLLDMVITLRLTEFVEFRWSSQWSPASQLGSSAHQQSGVYPAVHVCFSCSLSSEPTFLRAHVLVMSCDDSDSGKSQIAGRGQNSRQHSGPEVLQPPCSSQTSQSTGWMWWAVFRLACCCLIQI